MKFYNEMSLNRIFLTLSICTHCNMNCEYCCNDYFMKDNEKMMTDEELNRILRGLSFAKTPIELCIQGGEPAMYKKLGEFAYKACETKNILRVSVISNGTIPLNIIPHKKLSVCLSYHSYKINERQKQVFKENYYKYINKDLENVLILNMIYKDFKSDILDLIPDGNILNKPIFSLTRPNDKTIDVADIDNIEEPSKETCEQNGDLYNLDDKEYTYLEIFKQNLNHFYGWKCHMNTFFTDPWGNVRLGCVHNIVANLFRNPIFFKFTDEKILWCKKPECSYDCLLGCLKEKDEK